MRHRLHTLASGLLGLALVLAPTPAPAADVWGELLDFFGVADKDRPARVSDDEVVRVGDDAALPARSEPGHTPAGNGTPPLGLGLGNGGAGVGLPPDVAFEAVPDDVVGPGGANAGVELPAEGSPGPFPVPEPGTLTLLALGGAALLVRRRRAGGVA